MMTILMTSWKVVKCQTRMMKKLWRSISKGQKTFGLSNPKNTLKMRKWELQQELLPSLLRKCVRSTSRGEWNSENMAETFGAIECYVISGSVCRHKFSFIMYAMLYVIHYKRIWLQMWFVSSSLIYLNAKWHNEALVDSFIVYTKVWKLYRMCISKHIHVYIQINYYLQINVVRRGCSHIKLMLHD